MLFTNSKNSFAKDPAVVNYCGSYYLYYTTVREDEKLTVGIAKSKDLDNWEEVGEIPLEQEIEKTGIAAPAAFIRNGVLHLFYQSYGTWARDCILHSTSQDGIHFLKDATNPVFRPSKDWCSGRAIDADVVEFRDRLFMYFATRTFDMKIQMLGVASADIRSDYSASCWRQEKNGTILKPELDWEQECIEAPASVAHSGKVLLFYGGAYNCHPQQIGLASSENGIDFTRVSKQPYKSNGEPGDWNEDESGHPYIFEDIDGKIYLFFQGHNKHGWFLSKEEIIL